MLAKCSGFLSGVKGVGAFIPQGERDVSSQQPSEGASSFATFHFFETGWERIQNAGKCLVDRQNYSIVFLEGIENSTSSVSHSFFSGKEKGDILTNVSAFFNLQWDSVLFGPQLRSLYGQNKFFSSETHFLGVEPMNLVL